MNEIYNSPFKKAGLEQRVCRVSYTINNTQPVLSTIIGDQPLFYMDEADTGDADDTLFDLAELKILEQEIETLKQEIETLDAFNERFEDDSGRSHELLMESRNSFTGQKKTKDTVESFSIADIEAALRQSRFAQTLLDFAQSHGVSLQAGRQVETAFYDRSTGLILLNAGLPRQELVLLAARELRRHWQHRQGALINPLLFHPDSAVLINRAQIADSIAGMVRIAWELQLAGDKEVWERLEKSSLHDLGRAFAREAYLDFRTLNNGQACAAVFEAWFLSDRCRYEDRKMIKQMLADHQGYVFDLDQCEHMVTPALIAALGEMPFGKNYLAPHAKTIMEDTIFTEVRDRSNANFLWFIKFERSFRETEQGLQHDDVSMAGDSRQRPPSKTSQDSNHGRLATGAQGTPAAPQTADVIPFEAAPQNGSGEGLYKAVRLFQRLDAAGGGPNANIVYLRRGPTE